MAHAVRPPVVLVDGTGGTIANLSSIVQTPNSELVQVKYNRVVRINRREQGDVH